MRAITLRMTAQEYAEMKEALAYLRKRLALDPAMRDEATVTLEELDEISNMLDWQVDGADLVGMLLSDARCRTTEGAGL